MKSPIENPLVEFVKHQRVVVLDGGLATTLETRGHVLDDELWSAKILMTEPEAIQQVHVDFLAAGADCITTATYQATIPGFKKRGLSNSAAAALLTQSVDIAVEARDQFWSDERNHPHRLRPLVAASIGPYGAFLADGSEYLGKYDIDEGELYAFHKDRWQVLANTKADLLACETIPSRREAGVLLRLLQETPHRWAWLSFSCRDATRISDGSSLADVARECAAEERVAAIGINCTSPEFVSSLIAEARQATDKPIIVYPNSGEEYDVATKEWVGSPQVIDWAQAFDEWTRLGAVGIGGCCRIGPQEIATVRQQVG